MADNTIKIGGELESMATGKVVAAASAIKDKSRNKTQEVINGDVEAAIAEQSVLFEALSEKTSEAVESASKSAKEAEQYLADLQEAITELPDGQAVSAQVAANQTDITGLKSKTDSISKQSTQSEEEAIRFETDGGTLVGKVDSTGADFTDLKRGGNQVATTNQLVTKDTSIGDSPSNTNVPTTKAVKDYVDAHSGGDYPIDTETTASVDEEQVWGNDAETQEYAKIGSYGIKSKAYLDMNGNNVILTKDTSIGETPSQTNVPTSKAVADYVEAHGGGGTGDLPISKEATTSVDEEQVWGNDAGTDTYIKIGSYGLKAKALLDLNGRPFINEDTSISTIGKVVYTLGSSSIMLMGTQQDMDENNVRTWTALKNLLGASKLYNLGLGGGTWNALTTDTSYPVADDGATPYASNQIKWLKRLVDSGDYEAPNIIFMQFTNGLNLPMTNFDAVMALSFSELEADLNIRKTFYGGMRYAFELIYRYFPYASVFVSTGNQCNESFKHRGYGYISGGREGIEKMCDRYSIHMFNMMAEIGIVDMFEVGKEYPQSFITITSGATSTTTLGIYLDANKTVQVSVENGDSANAVAQKISNAINAESYKSWTATYADNVVTCTVNRSDSTTVVQFQAGTSGVAASITFDGNSDGIYLGADGLHPNRRGNAAITRYVATRIKRNYFDKYNY